MGSGIDSITPKFSEVETMQFQLKLLCLLVVLDPPSQVSDVPDPKRLEANVLSLRRQILRGELELDCEGWDESSPLGSMNYAHSLRLAFDGKLKRESSFVSPRH